MSERSAPYKARPEPLPPHSIEAEEAVLGAILVWPEAYQDAQAIVRGEDFYRSRNREVWEAIERCVAHGREPDLVTVSYEIKGDTVERLSLASLMSHMVATTPTSVHTRYYAQIVRETADCRRAIQQGGQIAAAGFNRDLATVRRLQQDASIVVNKRRKGGAVDA